ncbi:MAG: tRNA (adenosine(37)-N6)-threonylcarbamoyltransferase complex ATPase subunit type 1 TsaE [Candidatus Eisenbacteria bacterium]|nr:tRNA (adenosine(37)-N6)-threonylcarbamoyltransferase complex ATPase subunit type 1 TsaE [Candidatus Eisenbacteria bacterium]
MPLAEDGCESVFHSGSEEETASLGRRIGRILAAGDVVALTGELGAGKSVVARGICEGLGVRQKTRSPSFAFVNRYRGPVDVFHVDLYRIEGPGDLASLGLDDVLFGPHVTLIEWAEKLGPAVSSRALEVVIETVGEDERKITVRCESEAGRKLVRELAGEGERRDNRC